MTPKAFGIPIAFTTYQVKYVKALKDCSGRCDVQKKLIELAPGTNAENVRATLWHEVLHGIFHELGRPELCSDEALIEGLAISLMRIRLDVPSL